MVLDENLAVLPGGFGRHENNGRLFLRDKYLAEQDGTAQRQIVVRSGRVGIGAKWFATYRFLMGT